jgi:glutamine---fructose-6-phosphate transaminase (isomerizing)
MEVIMAFIDEIRQQPDALRNVIKEYCDEGNVSAEKLSSIIKNKKYSQIIFTGMGSSYFAGYVSCAMLRKQGIRAYAFETKEFMNQCLGICGDDTLLVIISQSGESSEVVELCKLLKSDENVIVVTNYADKTLYKYGVCKFLLYAGSEYYTASKTYTNTIAAIIYISYLIMGREAESRDYFEKNASYCADIMEKWIDDKQNIDSLVDFFRDASSICLIGSNASYCSASHGELLVEEAGKMFSTRYLAAQFIHGPVELISPQYIAIAFDFSEDTRKEIDRIIDNIVFYGGKLCVVTNRDLKSDNERLKIIKINLEDEFYAPLIEIIPVELLINYLGTERGLKPGVLTRVVK